MKKRALFLMFVSLVFLQTLSAYAGTPHTATGQVHNNDASVPANGTVTFNAYITTRTGEVQTESSNAAGYVAGYWFINVGNFATDWSIGEVLHVDFTNTVTGVTGSSEVTLTSDDPDFLNYTFPPPPPTLTMNAVSPPGSGSTTPTAGDHEYTSGEVVNIAATAATGYEFAAWTGDTGDIADVNDPTTTITMNSDYTITATFQLTTHTFNMGVSPPGSGTTTPAIGAHEYDYGDVVNLTATPATGYEFVAWTGNTGTVADVNDPTTTVTIQGDYTITATFQKIPYDLTLTAVSPASSGSTTPAQGSHGYEYGDVVNITAKAAAGYEFSAWTGDVDEVADVNDSTTTITMYGDYTVTATFLAVPNTLTMNAVTPPGSGTTTPAAGGHEYDYGEVVNISATAGNGYEFVAWTGDTGDIADVNDPTTTITMNGDYAVTATFQVIRNTLTVGVSPTASGTTTPTIGSHEYDEADVVNITATAATGYEFVAWTGDTGDIADVNDPTTTITMNGDYTITATFQKIPHTLTMNAVSPLSTGSTTPAEGAHGYEYGDVVNITATAATGYEFVEWTGDIGTIADVNDPATTITINGDYSITATFQIIRRTLDIGVAPPGSGTTLPTAGSHEYDHGDVVDISASSETGYMFVAWTGDISQVADVNDSTTTITMNGDYSITATFSPPPSLTINISPAGTGTTTPLAGVTHDYSVGAPVNLTAIPETGYEFVNWTGDVSTISNVNSPTATITMNGQYTISANFQLIQHTLSIGVSPENSGTTSPVAGSHEYGDGELVQISVTAAAGFEFVNWTGDVADPNNESTTVTMDADKTVTANFLALETVSPPTDMTGEAATYVDKNEEYMVSDATSSLNHDLEYMFDWGDGLGDWGDAEQSHNWSEPDTYQIKVRARCADHTGIVSEWSEVLETVSVEGIILDARAMAEQGGDIEIDPVKDWYRYGEVVQLTTTGNEGYVFHCWSTDETDTGITVTLTQHTTVVAYYYDPVDPEVPPVTVSDQGGKIDEQSCPLLGVLGLEDLTIDIPTGATSTPIQIHIDIPDDTVIPANPAFRVVEFKVQGHDDYYGFDEPLTISIPYPSSVINEDNLTIRLWNERVQDWVPIELTDSVQIDKENKMVSAQIIHFSIYSVMDADVPVAVDEPSDQTPIAFEVYPSYPNPFNSSTTIPFNLGKECRVTVQIYDMLGREVSTLHDGIMSPGRYNIAWHVKKEQNAEPASGIYFYRITADNTVYTGKLTYLR